jgi:Cof subfamily protein (haloacid dehalogenase superfamily)
VSFRLVACDLDGTLLRSDGTLSRRNIAALHAVREAGIRVVIVTGRPPRWVDHIADELELDGVVICSNGALLYDLASRRVVDEQVLPGEVCARLAATVRAVVPGVAFACERATGLALEPDYRSPHGVPREALRQAADELFAAPVAKLLAIQPDLDYPELFAAVARAVGSDAVVTQSGSDGLVEISAVGVTKAFAVQRLCAERGIAATAVIAFGDMPNDVALLQWAGHGVAVAGAHPDALAAADEVTKSNDDDGVAEVIERLLADRPRGRS